MTPSPLPQDVILSGLKCNLNVAKDIEWQWHSSDAASNSKQIRSETLQLKLRFKKLYHSYLLFILPCLPALD